MGKTTVTKEMVLLALKEYFEKYGEVPTKEKARNSKFPYNPSTVIRKFGSWNNALLELNLPVNKKSPIIRNPEKITCKKCGREFDYKQFINEKWVYLQNRYYCLYCSPYKEHNTAKLHIHESIKSIEEGWIICSTCKEKKSIKDFYHRSEGIYRWECKTCHNNRVSHHRYTRRVNLKLKAADYLGGKCQMCGRDDYLELFDFHHLFKDKEFNISVFLKGKSGKSINWNNMIEEIKKCQLLCGNCHRKLHYETHQPQTKKALIYRENKIKLVGEFGGCCKKCGYSECVASLDFHHLDPNNKYKKVSALLGNYERALAEANKCVLICSMCHRIEHWII